MASQAALQPLADYHDSSDNEGPPTAWGNDAANTDLHLVFEAPDCARVVCKVHTDRIREGAPGDTPPLGHVISKWFVEQLAAEPEATTITIEVTSGMQQVAHKLVDYLYGKPLEQSPESAVHLLVLCRRTLCGAGAGAVKLQCSSHHLSQRVVWCSSSWQSSPFELAPSSFASTWFGC